ncbi:enoyl-CoA hydratase/isomerase family protein [Flavisphingomonas formosensis]|uniref:enoyl-CoA hydratase/isomerase family protein n=1 Tax=Flavisphingomonas formosensis TaxID=861534 RepID=UPI0012F9A2EB|nr:enoyl-CoA hydratase-related protein [Sphingomonas formosensis]
MERINIDRQDGICTITLNRPERLNAIDEAMTRTLTQSFEALHEDSEIRVVVIAGAGKHFSSGGDIGNIADWLSADAEARRESFSHSVRSLSKPLSLALEQVPQPVIASVRGHAIGVALQIVILADLVVASDTARFTLPQLDLAHTPDHGETWALPRKIGLSRALQMSLMAERIDAATAERYNLVNWLVPDAELDARTIAVARRIAASPPVAARGAKALFLGAGSLTLAEAMEAEAAMLGRAASQEDFVEAITAFTEKRAPQFSGR